MEQDTQTSENNNQAGGGVIFRKPKKKNNKKIILLVLIIIAVLGIASYFLFFSDKGDDNVLVPENENAEEVKIDKELDSDQDGLPDYIEKVLGTYVNNSDTDGDGYSDFEEIKNGYDPLGDGKYTEEEWEAVKGKINDEDGEIFKNIFGSSISVENLELEEKINKAISICQKIEDSDQKDYCFALAKNNSLECESQSSILKEGCYLMFALRDKDTSLCEKSLDSDFCLATVLKEDSRCEASDDKDACYLTVAKSWEDSSVCQKIEDKTLSNSCFAVIDQDVNFCKKNEAVDNHLGASCYISLAMVKNDISVCSEMKNENKIICEALVNKDKNSLDCETNYVYCSIAGFEMMDDSFCDLIKINDSSNNILSKHFRDSCYLGVVTSIFSTF